MFESIFGDTLTIGSVSLTILFCIILGLIISYVHMKTSKYTKNFVITLAILPLLVAVVMMMVNGNLGTSVAILGAFSLIRFRSIPGNAREIASVFWTMSIGLALGMGQVFFASLITIIVAILLIILAKTKFGEPKEEEKELKILVPEDLEYDTIFDDVFEKYADKVTPISVKTVNMGSIFELVYHIVLKSDIKEQEFLNDLRIKNGNLKVRITHSILSDTL